MRIGCRLLFLCSCIVAGSPVAVFAQAPAHQTTQPEPNTPSPGTPNPAPPSSAPDAPPILLGGEHDVVVNPCLRPKPQRPPYCDAKK
jgi:hypothetical protein